MKLIATRKTEGGMHCIFVLLLCWLLEDISALLCIYTLMKRITSKRDSGRLYLHSICILVLGVFLFGSVWLHKPQY